MEPVDHDGQHRHGQIGGWSDVEADGPLTEQMRQLADIGASLCAYLPGAGHPDEWPTARCDCKFAARDINALIKFGAGVGGGSTEVTGCAEVRQAWRVLAMLQERYR